MNWRNLAFLMLLAFVVGACSDDEEDKNNGQQVTFEYSFKESAEGWQGGFADYPEGDEEFYELSFKHATLPEPLDQTRGALKQSGNNHSDDLFMFVKKKVFGLAPNQIYKVAFEVEIASNASNDSYGVGGSPGSSVYIKAGISSEEPVSVEQNDGYFRMNIDKNNQVNSGEDMKLLGDFTNGTDSDSYALKKLQYQSGELKARANEDGVLWLIVGTDSGFESTTTIYYNQIRATLDIIGF